MLKGYHIETGSYEVKGGWVPRAKVTWYEGPTTKVQELLAPAGYLSKDKQAADNFAFEMAKKWVDRQE